MSENPLDYEKQIWNVFAVGVISSVIILFYYSTNKLPLEWGIFPLVLGFFILIYSFFVIKGCITKRGVVINFPENYRLKETLSHKNYFRAKWMGEFILIFIALFYFFSFHKLLYIPIIILLIVILLFWIANLQETK